MNNLLTFFTLYVSGFVGYTGFSLLFPVMPLYARQLGASLSEVGLVVALGSYVTALLLVPFGALADRIGRRTLLVAGFTVFALAPLLYPLATNPGQLLLFRAVHGLTTAAFVPAVTASIIDLASPSRRGEALGWYTTATQMGFVAGPITGGLLLYYYSFNAAFYGCSAIALLGLLFILWKLTAIPQRLPQSLASDRSLTWLKERRVFAGLLTPFFVTVGSGAIATYIPLYGRGFGLTEAQAGLVITAVYAASTVLRAPSGRLSDKIGRKPVILLGLALSAVSVGLLSQCHSFVSLIVVAFFFGTGMGLAIPSGFALVADLSSPGMRGIAMGMTSSFLQAGIAIGATVMGVIAGISNFEIMFVVCASTITFGLLLIFGLVRGQN